MYYEEGIGYGRRRLIEKIITQNWGVKHPEQKDYKYNELLFVFQELLSEEGKAYQEHRPTLRGHQIFRDFVKHLMYRNIANYDSMVLITSEKGCLTDDTLIEMPRDLIKYPKGIPIKDLINKGKIYVYSFNIKTKMLEIKESDGVEFVKEADIYELKLVNGMTIKATNDHPFMMIDGSYKQLKDIIYKDDNGNVVPRYMKNNKLVYTDRLRIFSRRNKLNGDNFIKYDFNKIDRKNGDKPYNHVIQEHRFIAKEIFGDIENKIVHHKDRNHFNNNINNLELLNSHSEHFYNHGMDKYLFKFGNKIGALGFGYSTKKKLKIRNKTFEFNCVCSEKRKKYCNQNLDKISEISIQREKENINSNYFYKGARVISVKYLGKQNVYDVVNVRDNHNFIANGFIVSNTGKSSAAMMIAREWCRLLGIRFNPDRHIAYNNADMMTKIELLNKFEPIIADEAIRFACLEGNSMIKTPVGAVPIKELEGKKNFKVYSYNKKTKKEEIKVAEKCIKVREDVIYEIETEDGKKIKATKEHKFLTNKGWTKLKNLKEGDNLVDI